MNIKPNNGSLIKPSKRSIISTSIRTKILEIVNQAQKPVSTREIGSLIARSWHTIQTHCLRLQLEGKITGYKVGNLNLWVKLSEVKGKG